MNSAASRAYLETAASPKTLMMLGMKHSLCFTSIVSKAQPSLSIPTKKSCVFRNSRRGVCGSSGTDMRLPSSGRVEGASSQIVVVDGGGVQAAPSPHGFIPGSSISGRMRPEWLGHSHTGLDLDLETIPRPHEPA